jgi:hypothetical protein
MEPIHRFIDGQVRTLDLMGDMRAETVSSSPA